jgi:hypothetical protein
LFVAMRRAFVIAGVMLAALLAMAPAAGASTKPGAVFYLHARGFFVEGRSERGGERIRLFLGRHGEVAEYLAPVRLGAGTVTARLGRLGSIDLRFRPGHGEGPLGCGRTEGWQRGSFVGSIDFRGEHDYAGIDAGRARGWFRTRPTGPCPKGGGDRSFPRPPVGRHPKVAETGAQIFGRTSTRTPARVFWFFTEERHGSPRVRYQAYLIEKREGMEIARGDDVFGGAATFEWDLGAETARVEPPAPFSGHAFYRSRPGGRPPLWRGSLSAPVLGAPPMALTGPVFGAHLGRLS